MIPVQTVGTGNEKSLIGIGIGSGIGGWMRDKGIGNGRPKMTRGKKGRLSSQIVTGLDLHHEENGSIDVGAMVAEAAVEEEGRIRMIRGLR